jgi:hypothetical protein
MKTINVVVKRPGQKAEKQFVEPTLAGLQAVVGGYLEEFTRGPSGFGKTRIITYVNEDGRRLGLQPNSLGIAGTILVTGLEAGKNISLPDRVAVSVIEYLNLMSPPR